MPASDTRTEPMEDKEAPRRDGSAQRIAKAWSNVGLKGRHGE